jgi:hypothetical protein
MIFCLTVALAAACAPFEPTPYQPAADGLDYSEAGFGYSETARDGGYVVRFDGNDATGRQTVEDYALYRAAEIALRDGSPRFAVLDRLVERRIVREPTSIRPYSLGYAGHGPPMGYRRSNALLPTLRPGDYTWRNIVSYSAELVVRPFAGSPPEGAMRLHDAREVMDRLGPRLVRPGAEP